MSKIAYYLFIWPLSLLPLRISYVLSNFLFFVLFYLVKYRREVVFSNVKLSFPEKDSTEINSIVKNFYRNFCDIIIESVRLFSMPDNEVKKRCTLKNVDIIENYIKEGQSVLLAAGHMNNWELAILSISLQSPVKYVGIYKSMKNPFFEKLFRQSRSRYGLGLINAKHVKSYFQENINNPQTYFFAIDQSPNRPNKAYWTYFLNRETGVKYGLEKYARQYNYPIVFGNVTRLKRGYYEMNFELLMEDPTNSEYGDVVKISTRHLESIIQKYPSEWLWSHRRWKHNRPPEMELNP